MAPPRFIIGLLVALALSSAGCSAPGAPAAGDNACVVVVLAVAANLITAALLGLFNGIRKRRRGPSTCDPQAGSAVAWSRGLPADGIQVVVSVQGLGGGARVERATRPTS